MSEDRTPDNPADAAEDSAEDVPMNRAERRAKGKKSAQQTQFGSKKQGVSPKNAQSHAQRIWANRRAG